jgi:HEAT repeat protein
VEDPRRSEALRGHAAEGLALLGARSPEAVRALVVALSEPNAEVLRRQAALALSVLDAPFASSHLLREPGTAKTEHLMAQLAVCVGRLDDLSAVEPLLAVARDPRRGELTRALAVVSLGHLADPERRPVLHRLSIDANYPARTDALHSAFMIL